MAELQDNDDCDVTEGLSPVDVADVIGKLVAVRRILDPDSAGVATSDIGKMPGRSASFDESAELIAEMKSSLAEVKTLLEERTACYRKLSASRKVMSVTHTEICTDNQNITNAELCNKIEITTGEEDAGLQKSDPCDGNIKATPSGEISVPAPSVNEDNDASTHTSPSQRSDAENDFVAWCQESVRLSDDILCRAGERDVNAVDNMAGFLSKNLDRTTRHGTHGEKLTGRAGVNEYIEEYVPTKTPSKFRDVSDISEFLAADLVSSDGQRNLQSSDGVSNFRLVCAASAHRSPTLEVIASNAFVVDRVKALETACKGPFKLRADVTSLESEMIYQREHLRALRVNDEAGASSFIENASSLKRDATLPCTAASSSTINTTIDTSSASYKVGSSPTVDVTSRSSVRRLLKQFENHMHSPPTESADKGQSGRSEVVNRAYQIMHDVERTGEAGSDLTAYDGDMSLVEAYAEFENCRIGYMMEPSAFSGGNFDADSPSLCSSRSEQYGDTDCELGQDSIGDDESVCGVEDIKSPMGEEVVSQQWRGEELSPAENLDDTEQHRFADNLSHVRRVSEARSRPNEEYCSLSTATMVRKFDEMISHQTQRFNSNQALCESTEVCIADKKKFFEKPAVDEVVSQRQRAEGMCPVENLDDIEQHRIADDVSQERRVPEVQSEYGPVVTATVVQKFDEMILLEAQISNSNQASCQNADVIVYDEKQDFEKPVVEEVSSQQQCVEEMSTIENLDVTGHEEPIASSHLTEQLLREEENISAQNTDTYDCYSHTSCLQMDSCKLSEENRDNVDQCTKDKDIAECHASQDVERACDAECETVSDGENPSDGSLVGEKQDIADTGERHNAGKVSLENTADAEQDAGRVTKTTSVKQMIFKFSQLDRPETIEEDTNVKWPFNEKSAPESLSSNVRDVVKHHACVPALKTTSVVLFKEKGSFDGNLRRSGVDHDAKSVLPVRADTAQNVERNISDEQSVGCNPTITDSCSADEKASIGRQVSEELSTAIRDSTIACTTPSQALEAAEFDSSTVKRPTIKEAASADADCNRNIIKDGLVEDGGGSDILCTESSDKIEFRASGLAATDLIDHDLCVDVEDNHTEEKDPDENMAQEELSSGIFDHTADSGTLTDHCNGPFPKEISSQATSRQDQSEAGDFAEECTDEQSTRDNLFDENDSTLQGDCVTHIESLQEMAPQEFPGQNLNESNQLLPVDVQDCIAKTAPSKHPATDDFCGPSSSDSIQDQYLPSDCHVTEMDFALQSAVEEASNSNITKQRFCVDEDLIDASTVSAQAVIVDDTPGNFPGAEPNLRVTEENQIATASTEDLAIENDMSACKNDSVVGITPTKPSSRYEPTCQYPEDANDKVTASISVPEIPTHTLDATPQDTLITGDWTETAVPMQSRRDGIGEDFQAQPSITRLHDEKCFEGYSNVDETGRFHQEDTVALKFIANDDTCNFVDHDLFTPALHAKPISEEGLGISTRHNAAAAQGVIANQGLDIASRGLDSIEENVDNGYDPPSDENDQIKDRESAVELVSENPVGQYRDCSEHDSIIVLAKRIPDNFPEPNLNSAKHEPNLDSKNTVTAVSENIAPHQCIDVSVQQHSWGDIDSFLMKIEKPSTDECQIANFDAAADGMTIAEKTALPEHQVRVVIEHSQNDSDNDDTLMNVDVDDDEKDLLDTEYSGVAVTALSEQPAGEGHAITDRSLITSDILSVCDDACVEKIVSAEQQTLGRPNIQGEDVDATGQDTCDTKLDRIRDAPSVVEMGTKQIASQSLENTERDLGSIEEGQVEELTLLEKQVPESHDAVVEGACVSIDKFSKAEDGCITQLTPPEEQTTELRIAAVKTEGVGEDDFDATEVGYISQLTSPEEQTTGICNAAVQAVSVSEDHFDTTRESYVAKLTTPQERTTEIPNGAVQATGFGEDHFDAAVDLTDLTSPAKQETEIPDTVVRRLYTCEDNFGVAQDRYVTELTSPEKQTANIPNAAIQAEVVSEDHFDTTLDNITELTSHEEQISKIPQAAVQAEGVIEDHLDTAEDSYIAQFTFPEEQTAEIPNAAVQAAGVCEYHFDTTEENEISNAALLIEGVSEATTEDSHDADLTSPEEKTTRVSNATVHSLCGRENNFGVAEDGYVTELSSFEKQAIQIPDAAVQDERDSEDDCSNTKELTSSEKRITEIPLAEDGYATELTSEKRAIGSYDAAAEGTSTNEDISHIQEEQAAERPDAAIEGTSASEDHFGITEDKSIAKSSSPDEGAIQIEIPCVSKDLVGATEDGYIAEFTSDRKQTSEISHDAAKDLCVLEGNFGGAELTRAENHTDISDTACQDSCLGEYKFVKHEDSCAGQSNLCATEDSYGAELSSPEGQTHEISDGPAQIAHGIQGRFDNTENSGELELASPTLPTMESPSTQDSNATVRDSRVSENYHGTVTDTSEQVLLPSNVSSTEHCVPPVQIFENFQHVTGCDNAKRLLSEGDSDSYVADTGEGSAENLFHRTLDATDVLADAESENESSAESLDQKSDGNEFDCSQDQAVHDLRHQNAGESQMDTGVTKECHLAETAYVDPPNLEEATTVMGDAADHDFIVAIENDATNTVAVDGHMEFSIPHRDQTGDDTFDCVRFVEVSESEPRGSASEWDSSITETTTEDQLILQEMSGRGYDTLDYQYSASEQSSTEASIVGQRSPVGESTNDIFEASDSDNFETEKAAKPATFNNAGIEVCFGDRCISETTISASFSNRVVDEHKGQLHSTPDCDVAETISLATNRPDAEERDIFKQTSTEKSCADKSLHNTARSTDRDIDACAINDDESAWRVEADEMSRLNPDVNICVRQSTECCQDSNLTVAGVGNQILDERQHDGGSIEERSGFELSTASALENSVLADIDMIPEIDKAVSIEDNLQHECHRVLDTSSGNERFSGQLEKGTRTHAETGIEWTDVQPTRYSDGSYLPHGQSLGTLVLKYGNREVNSAGTEEFVNETVSHGIGVLEYDGKELDSTQIIPDARLDDNDSVWSDDGGSINEDCDASRDFKFEEFDDTPSEHHANDVGGTTGDTSRNAASKETPVSQTVDSNVQECAEVCKYDFASNKPIENIACSEDVTTVPSGEQEGFHERCSVDNVTAPAQHGVPPQTAACVYDTDTYDARNDLFLTEYAAPFRHLRPSGNSISGEYGPNDGNDSSDENNYESDNSDSERVVSVLSLQSDSPVSQEQGAFTNTLRYPSAQSSEFVTSVDDAAPFVRHECVEWGSTTNHGRTESPVSPQIDENETLLFDPIRGSEVTETNSTGKYHKSDLMTETGIESPVDCVGIFEQGDIRSEKSLNETHEAVTSCRDDGIICSTNNDSSVSTAVSLPDATAKVNLDDSYDKLWNTAQDRRESCELTFESNTEQITECTLAEISKPSEYQHDSDSVDSYPGIPTVVVTSTDGSCETRDSVVIEDDSNLSDAENSESDTCVQSVHGISHDSQDVENRECFGDLLRMKAYQSNVSLDSLEGDTVCAVDSAGYAKLKSSQAHNFDESNTSTSACSSECDLRDLEYKRADSDDENGPTESPYVGNLLDNSSREAACDDEVDFVEDYNDDTCREDKPRDLPSHPENAEFQVNLSTAHDATDKNRDPSDLHASALSDFLQHKNIAGERNFDVSCPHKGSDDVNELGFCRTVSGQETAYNVSPQSSAGVIPSAPLLSDCCDKDYDDDVMDTAASRDVDLETDSATGSGATDFPPQKDATLYYPLKSVTSVAGGGLKLSNPEDLQFGSAIRDSGDTEVKSSVKTEFSDTHDTQGHFHSVTHESASMSWITSENNEIRNFGSHGTHDRVIPDLPLAFESRSDDESQNEAESSNLINFATDSWAPLQPAGCNMSRTDAELTGNDQACKMRSASQETFQLHDNITTSDSPTVPFAGDIHQYYGSQDLPYERYNSQESEFKPQLANYSTEIPVANVAGEVTSVVWSGAVTDCVVSDGLAISRRDLSEHYVRSVNSSESSSQSPGTLRTITESDVSERVQDFSQGTVTRNAQLGEISAHQAACHASYTRHDITRVVSSARETVELRKELVTSAQFESMSESHDSKPIIPSTQWWDNQGAGESSMRDILSASGSLQTVQDHQQWAAFFQSRDFHSEMSQRTNVTKTVESASDIEKIEFEYSEIASSSGIDAKSIGQQYSGSSDASQCQS